MNIRDVMTKDPICARSDSTLADAARMMLDNHIGGLPVIDKTGGLVGVLTEADIMRRGELNPARRWDALFLSPARLTDEFVRAHARRVDEIMSDPISIDERMSVESAMSTMESNRVRRLPVTRCGKLCGIVSRSDLLRAYFVCRTQTCASYAQFDDAIDRCA